MPTHAIPPDDSLRDFLLGVLPAEQVEAVRRWLDADPTNVARLDRLAVRDAITEALSDASPTESVPEGSVERILRGVTATLQTVGIDAATTADHREHPTRVPTEPHSAFSISAGWPPEQIGQFRIICELGHGGMGYVFEAEDERLGRRVAIKMLAPSPSLKGDMVARFLREARAAAAIEHGNVVPILHTGENAGAPYIVMPLLKGESLQARLKRNGKLSVAQVIRLGREVSAGLAAAHAQGLIHRDLKPGNIWLDEGAGRARILDFGLARQGGSAEALTAAGALLGTPAYMPPEQINGHADSRSDLFSLGATLYECATGQRPFDGPTITAILKAVSEHNPPPPIALDPDFPPGLSLLIMQLLAKNPSERPPSASVIVTALTGDVSTITWSKRPDAAPVSGAMPTALGGRLTPPPSFWRQPWLWAAAAVLLVAGSVGIWLATRPTRMEDVDKPPATVRYQGKIDVLVERKVDGGIRLLRLNEAGALPLKLDDRFRIEAEVDPPAYVYVVWVDPDHDVTPVYPWDPKEGWGSRPATEEKVRKVSLPPSVGNRYTARTAKPGVATMVLIARSTPLDVPDDKIKEWFEKLPELPLPGGSETAAVWFDDYIEVRDSMRKRTFGEVSSDDAFARWQGQLQKALGDNAVFQTAVSFARTGRK